MVTAPETDVEGDGIRAAAAAALEDVDALGVDGQDRSIILKAVLRARLGGFPPASNATTPVNTNGRTTGGRGGSSADAFAPGDVMGKLSSAFGLDRDTLELVYDIREGEPHLVIAAKRFSTQKAQATKELAQLIAAGRQAAGIEEWTTAGTIRPVVQDYGRLDVGNFASYLKQMDAVAVSRGNGRTREFKITRPGIENTADLIKTLTGSGDS